MNIEQQIVRRIPFMRKLVDPVCVAITEDNASVYSSLTRHNIKFETLSTGNGGVSVYVSRSDARGVVNILNRCYKTIVFNQLSPRELDKLLERRDRHTLD